MMNIKPKKNPPGVSNSGSKILNLAKGVSQGNASNDDDKIERQKRADALRKQGAHTQAFFVEHLATIGITVFFIALIGVGGYMHYSRSKTAELGLEYNLKLEKIESELQRAIKQKDTDRALELVAKLVHPVHERDESKFDFIGGSPYYDEYWEKKREEYRDEINKLER